jgi:hypothetical protein
MKISFWIKLLGMKRLKDYIDSENLSILNRIVQKLL